jgi:hypothetical protein
MESLVVQFGESVSASQQFAVFELDDQFNVDADGKVKTQFYPREEVFLRLHHGADLRVTQVIATDGMVVDMGSGSRDITTQQVFPAPLVETGTERTGDVTLAYIPAGNLHPSWMGRAGSGLENDGRQVWITGGEPCMADISYPVNFTLFKLIPPSMSLAGDEQYPVAVVAYLEAV